MIYPIGSKFFVLLSSWKGEFEIFMRAIPELKDMVVQAIILDRDTTTDSYLVGFKAIFEEHHKFESHLIIRWHMFLREFQLKKGN